MEQRSLRVVETNKTFFSKITNTLSKIIVPTKLGINGMMISFKRNNLIKAYNTYLLTQKTNDAEKIELVAQKYEDSYSLYLEVIDKNIMDSVYKKVKNGIASEFEKEALSKYYLIVSLKNEHYLEYKYRKQEYLLKIDYETASNMKKEKILNEYKTFYTSKMDSLYKGLLKNYSVELADNVNSMTSNEKTYNKIFQTLENYVTEILPIKISIEKDNKKIAEEYDKYEQTTVGKLDERDKIMQKLLLLGISRQFFTHSLPLIATEKCYVNIIKDARALVLKSKNQIKKDKAYSTLFTVIEEYNTKLLSTKVYWDKPDEREEYKIFWSKYKKVDNIENEEEKAKQKQILFLKADLKKVYSNEKKYKTIIEEYKKRLLSLGAMREVKGVANGKSGSKFSGNKNRTKVH